MPDIKVLEGRLNKVLDSVIAHITQAEKDISEQFSIISNEIKKWKNADNYNKGFFKTHNITGTNSILRKLNEILSDTDEVCRDLNSIKDDSNPQDIEITSKRIEENLKVLEKELSTVKNASELFQISREINNPEISPFIYKIGQYLRNAEKGKLKGLVIDIEKDTVDNENFRKVLYTGKNSQLVLMSLEPGQDIGEETHDVDQFFRVDSGMGSVVIDGKESPIKDGSAIVVPAGAKHNVLNSGDKSLKLYSIYSPPHHSDGTIHKTKEDAEKDKEHFDGKTTEKMADYDGAL